jgi:hypothetical protein
VLPSGATHIMEQPDQLQSMLFFAIFLGLSSTNGYLGIAGQETSIRDCKKKLILEKIYASLKVINEHNFKKKS